jgi:hypothetical protein
MVALLGLGAHTLHPVVKNEAKQQNDQKVNQ